MIGALILVFSFAALGQFTLAYCRALLLTYGTVALSARTREVAGITGEMLAPEEFERLMGLVRLAPDLGDDATEIRAIKAYHRVMATAEWILSPLSRLASQWIEGELARCTYFAAITLDRRLVPVESSAS